MRKMETGVVVVAVGFPGLAACISAAENGTRVLAFKKSNTIGDMANIGMGPLGVGSRVQRGHIIFLTPGETFHKYTCLIHYRVDTQMARDYHFKSGDTINWLSSMGVEFAGVQRAFSAPENTRAYSDSEFTWHVCGPEDGGIPGPGAAAPMTKKMTGRVKDLGVEFLLETPVCKVIMEGGRTVEVMVKNEDGKEVEVRAQSVILATDGSSDNPVMIREETRYKFGKTISNFATPGMKGDGIKIVWEAGAGKEPCTMELMYQLPNNMNHLILGGTFHQPCLWVSRNGQRFMPEDQIGNATFTGNMVTAQSGSVAYSIFDSKLFKKYKKKGLDTVSHIHPRDLYDHFDGQWNRDLADGYGPIAQTDTIEELAERADVDAEGLAVQAEEYNGMCEAGFDEVFEKDRHYMQPVAKTPFYYCRQSVSAYSSLDGVKIDHETEVITQEVEVIPGPYCMRTNACNIFGDSYPLILSGDIMGFCLDSRRITGENATAGSDKFEYQRIQTAESGAEE